MFRTPAFAVIAASVMVWLAPAHAADPEVAAYTLDAVILEVLQRHPDLEISRLDAAIADTEVMRLDAGLDPGVSARIGLIDDRRPVASVFQPTETLTGAISGTLTQPFERGGTLSTTAEYLRTSQQFSSPFATQLAVVNPAYRGGLSINYRHPLLRGEGRPEFHDALAAAGADRAAAQLQRQVVARGLGIQALNAAFQILADDIGIRLARIGIERAERLLENYRYRVEFGLVETADRIQIEALLALRRLELQKAQAQKRSSQVELNRQMLRDPGTPLELKPLAGLPRLDNPSVEEGVRIARATRPEFQLLERQLEAEEARLRLARNADRPQLDLVAEFGVFALEGNALDATLVAFRDHYAGISLELTDVLGRRSAKAEALRSELGYQRLQTQYNLTLEQVRDELARIHVTIVTGADTLRFMRQRVEAEKRKLEAEIDRYREGRSDTATLIQFEADLHVAEIEADLQALTLWLADRQFAWSMGTMFEEMGIDLTVLTEDRR